VRLQDGAAARVGSTRAAALATGSDPAAVCVSRIEWCVLTVNYLTLSLSTIVEATSLKIHQRRNEITTRQPNKTGRRYGRR
jgi:hypothetical protein